MIKYKKFDIKKVSLFLTLIIYGIYQNYLILLGGTTWDEPASILSASKQIYKAYIFIVDPNNAVLENFVPPEFYGGLLFIPAYLVTAFGGIVQIFSRFFSYTELVNHLNELEIALIIRHTTLNLYVILILIFLYFKIKKDFGVNRAVLTVLVLLLIPSFNGHSLFNFADIPLGMQLFASSVFFISYLNNFDNRSNLILGILFGLTLLTRINAIVFLSFLPLFEFLQNYMVKRKYRFGKIYKKLFLKYLKIYSIAILIFIIGTPPFWKNPIYWLKEAYIYQFRHPNNVPSLLNGKEIFAYEAPRTYLIEWFAYRLPLGFIILFLISCGLYFFVREYRENSLFTYSLFFIFLVNLSFIIYNPVAYDGIRHYLFLLPFFAIVIAELFDYAIKKNKKTGNTIFVIFVIYMIMTQFGLGAYKYVYLNELVQKENISEECDEYVSQSGCGDWATDYWGFGGKELFNISKSYNQSILYFCPPHFTYSLFQESEKPWSLINGDFVFDDSYPFETDEVFYYQSDMLAHINEKEFKSIEFLSFNYHRPPGDSCGLKSLDKNKFDIYCEVIDGVKVKLRGYEIPINYLSKCLVEKIN